jgi:non-ribosomal peptide synthetase component F
MRMLDHWRTLLEAITANPAGRLADLSSLTAAEQRQFANWNHTQREYPRDRCIHELFLEQTARTPDAVALVYGTTRFTYREISDRAHMIASHLCCLGVHPDTPVALCLERSPEMVVTLLDAGADVNARDVRDMTPLMLAVATDRQNADVIRALIARKADVNVRSLAGETALDWARKIGNPSGIQILERAKAVATPAHASANGAFAPADMSTAVKRSLALLEKSSIEAAAQGGCASCHHHNITDIAAAIAREKGIAID